MIAELTKHDKFRDDNTNFHVPKDAFSSARCETKKILVSVEPQKPGINRRFPWTHRSEPGTSDVLQSENVLP